MSKLVGNAPKDLIKSNPNSGNNQTNNSFLVGNATESKKIEQKLGTNSAPKGLLATIFSDIFSTKEHQETTEYKSNDLKAMEGTKFKKSTIDLLMYKSFTDSGEHASGAFISENEDHYLIITDVNKNVIAYGEMLKIGGMGVTGMSAEMQDETLDAFSNFLRMYVPDHEYISMPLSNDTVRQQRQWQAELNRIETIIGDNHTSPEERLDLISRRDGIKDIIDRFAYMETALINQGFTLLLFEKLEQSVDTEREMSLNASKQAKVGLKKKVREVFDFEGGCLNLEPLTIREKKKILRKINNPFEVI